MFISLVLDRCTFYTLCVQILANFTKEVLIAVWYYINKVPYATLFCVQCNNIVITLLFTDHEISMWRTSIISIDYLQADHSGVTRADIASFPGVGTKLHLELVRHSSVCTNI